MRAIISDIHSNLEALQAVLQDLQQYHPQDIYCLGDIIGYGPNPRECLDLVMDCKVVVLGNHDQGAVFDPQGFNGAAERAIFWTRRQLEEPIPTRPRADRRWEFLGECPRSHREEGFFYVHASPRNPLNDYIFPEDIYNQRKMERLFAAIERYCFHGHSHLPGVITESWQFYAPEEIDYLYPLDGRKAFINVGSVGQPRDGDWRASYVLVDEEAVYFRRVEYDVETTIRKIYDIDDLDNFLGDRLPDGR
jgi:diadenosine tetraphosphatase ApaH/serine/threonine PP2A family protein phosphatase